MSLGVKVGRHVKSADATDTRSSTSDAAAVGTVAAITAVVAAVGVVTVVVVVVAAVVVVAVVVAAAIVTAAAATAAALLLPLFLLRCDRDGYLFSERFLKVSIRKNVCDGILTTQSRCL